MHLPILLLEDNADVRDLLVEAFSDNGAFAVHAAATISEAQTLAHRIQRAEVHSAS